MRYWWVNHNQTFEQELNGGYLWSPQKEANGARSQFYNNMRLAEPGDPVLSFAQGEIANIGIVRDFASPALKPVSFGTTGDYWSNDGWILPVQWRQLSGSFKPKARINELGPLLPKKYSPISRDTGKGHQKAYLAEIGEDAFELIAGRLDVNASIRALPRRSDEPALARIESLVERLICADPELDTTTKQQVVRARRGQGRFRTRIWEFEHGCRLTGLRNPRFLIASHIKPWRVCSTADERLDGANGLLLAPHVDFLFDKGFIGFSDEGSVLVSQRVTRGELVRFGLDKACDRASAPFSVRQLDYLAYHRDKVFLA